MDRYTTPVVGWVHYHAASNREFMGLIKEEGKKYYSTRSTIHQNKTSELLMSLMSLICFLSYNIRKFLYKHKWTHILKSESNYYYIC